MERAGSDPAVDVEMNNKMEVLRIEPSEQTKSGQKLLEYGKASAHAVDKDSWQQVGLLLVTSFNCAYILTFSNLMLVPLGWEWGIACLVIVGAFAFYANWLLAGLHYIDGQRFIRYRDLMGYVFGIL